KHPALFNVLGGGTSLVFLIISSKLERASKLGVIEPDFWEKSALALGVSYLSWICFFLTRRVAGPQLFTTQPMPGKGYFLWATTCVFAVLFGLLSSPAFHDNTKGFFTDVISIVGFLVIWGVIAAVCGYLSMAITGRRKYRPGVMVGHALAVYL